MTGGASPRRKGQRGEQQLVAWLRNNGYPDARRYLSGDGRQPGDIDGVPGMALEVKAVERLAIPAWLRQAEQAARGPVVPFVIWRIRGAHEAGEWAAMTRVRFLPRLMVRPPIGAHTPIAGFDPGGGRS